MRIETCVLVGLIVCGETVILSDIFKPPWPFGLTLMLAGIVMLYLEHKENEGKP